MPEKSKFKTAIILISVFLCLIIFYRIFSNVRAKKALEVNSINEMPVEVSKVFNGKIDERILLTGTIHPTAEVAVYSKFSGKLEKINKDVGDRVNRGEIIAIVEHKDLLLQVEQAEASLSVAKASCEQARVNYENAGEDLERMKNLFKDGTISKQQFDTAKNKFENTQAQLKLAEAQANNLQTATLKLAKEKLSDSYITAPISGIITLRNYDAGAMVSTSTSSNNNAIFKIEDIDVVHALTNVAEVDLQKIKEGLESQIIVAAFPGQIFQGKVTKITPSLDIVTRTSAVEIEISNKDHKLKSGFFANIIISANKISDALLVPKNAVLLKEGKNIAFVVNGGTAHLRRIETGLRDDKNIQVLKGLKEGDEVVISGINELEDGAKVTKEKI
ncbi:MAG: hypothetical protein A2W05_07360 [Candidatus Schekmanbacteria bacterium RBG_16_38_10]|uniref:Uncharacterized protein n=1 Tax=Candidatus Schekmanbacteria bacterium RBG_16_38_10 TaxID=1817879 RepID=A0A1F7RMM9_9BACT|nr:MAG: hypothetical protein A2W05_07360 [Candidatus Schekmanbacteria bacterium RBG_16_38_10]